MISLALNDIDIDWGKNRRWTNHHWLFPPGSITDVVYTYAGGVTETKPGFTTTLNDAYLRLCHLGYSQTETKDKFERVLGRWNRTSDLRLSYADFHETLVSIDFSSLTSADMEPFIWDFRRFLLKRLTERGIEDDLSLEDFILEELDPVFTIRALADRVENRPLPLCWQHYDLLENGWVSLEDLTDIDRPSYMVNHTVLFGRLQEYSQATTVAAFDNWLRNRKVPRTMVYREMRNGVVTSRLTTMPTAVRHMIHHPENPYNVLADETLRESVEILLGVATKLSVPLPGLS
ncbi:HEPN/Toprim-associated domain-containing protein [Arthrobacter sp. Soil763]|uniref:HEPN/Toprim-associated domain-containing protein n=1 Tax=Arthrobacter sp. Soil763 TaxID=1736402 RepID=UPI000A624828|nr:HEPN/Toprim-associated domain-containing protein [Arthrobacter sp. Soil763]